MKAKTVYRLPDEAGEFRAAMEGARLRAVVGEHLSRLRAWLKHGHDFAAADEALEAARGQLQEELLDEGIDINADY